MYNEPGLTWLIVTLSVLIWLFLVSLRWALELPNGSSYQYNKILKGDAV